jgi:predicted Zn-ribbon and HTH transcriptional regulator
MQVIAEERHGACLSQEYTNNKTKLRWRCAEGHEWEALPGNVLRGHWCKDCGNVHQGRSKAKSIADARALGRERGGECLSEEYINNNTPLHWKCGACGHEWEARESSIKQGSWCPKCAGRLAPDEALRELQKLATKKGGCCLNEQYLGARTKHRWRCVQGHEWEAAPYSIRAGTWCIKCSGNDRLTLEDMRETARKMGGDCLSNHYTNSSQKLHWRCSEGHEWFAVGYHVRSGHWCPTCTAGNSERICNDIFEQMFGKPFPKVKPAWLLNARGKRMELDGHCKELRIAFEYHGVQHYQHIGHFHREDHSLAQRKQDDALKEALCLRHGVRLIVIPYTVPAHEIPLFVAQHACRLGLALQVADPSQVVVAEYVLPKKLKQMQELARQKGGRCLSTAYFNNNTPLRWECLKGHTWSAVPGSIQQGSWCPQCAGKYIGDDALQQLRSIARSRGGQCLAEIYQNGRGKLPWRCAEGHEWSAAANNIRAGSWCPECAMKIKGPKRMGLAACREAAIARGGRCLSDTYVNTDTKLCWKCGDCGHEWEAIPYSVVRLGTWCPKCRGKRSGETRRSRQK